MTVTLTVDVRNRESSGTPLGWAILNDLGLQCFRTSHSSLLDEISQCCKCKITKNLSYILFIIIYGVYCIIFFEDNKISMPLHNGVIEGCVVGEEKDK